MRRLLVVQNNKQERNEIVHLISEGDVEVTAVGNGEQALEALKSCHFDCVILDLMLPDLPGMEVMRQVRQAGVRTPVLMLTALGSIDDRVREVFFRSVNSIESDFEHHRVLSAVADRGDASPEFLRAAVVSAARIDSDFELAQFLTSVAQRYTVDPALRGPYFEAVKTIDSDFELGRTLQAMVSRDADAAVLREVLVAARAIDSDFELAQLLVSVARARRIDDTLRPLFLDAMNGISSGYERERVARALERSGRAELD